MRISGLTSCDAQAQLSVKLLFKQSPISSSFLRMAIRNMGKDGSVRYQRGLANLTAKGCRGILRERLAGVKEFQYSLNKLHLS